MRRICNLVLVLSLSTSVLRAEGTADSSGNPVFKHYLGLRFRIESGSNGMNQYMINRLVLGGYMGTEKIEKAEKHIHAHNRMGVAASYSVGFNLKSSADTNHRWLPEYVYLTQNQIVGASFSQGAWQSVFRGNAPYLGQTLNLGKSGFTQFASRAILFQWKELKILPDKSGRIAFDIGLGQLLAYRKLNIKSGSIYTDSSRNYVDAQYSGTYVNGGSNATRGIGYGMTFGSIVSIPNKGGLRFGISNLGVYKYNHGDKLSKEMDAPARIHQTTLGLKSLNSTDWINHLKDTVNIALAPDSAKSSAWIVSPFTVFLEFNYKVMKIKMDYIFMQGYLPKLSISPARLVFKKNKFLFNPEFQLGGFDTWNLNAEIMYLNILRNGNRDKGYVHGFLRVQGIEAWALPSLTHGSGVWLGLSVSRF